ncbi:hypothetical protein [Steroidobacter denitrificans]|nr:hypothetical protein [Steroidobacter denitrificans]
MSAARLFCEAQAMAALLHEAAQLSEDAGLPANAQRYRMAADLIERLAQRLPIFTLRAPL